MRISPLIIAPVLYFLAKGASTVYNATRLNFFIYKIVPRFSGITPILDFYIGVQNPTSGNFVVQSLAGNVFANDTNIGTLSSFTLTTVKPNSQTIFIATLRLSLIGIIQDVWNKVSGGLGNLSYTIKITGTINIGGAPLPVLLSYKII